jgi:hypothetical protein
MEENMKNVLLTIICLTLLSQGKESNFSILNMTKVPSYEKYVFAAVSTKYEDMPVVIEYTRPNDSTWNTNASMKIGNKRVQERYVIKTDNLLITEYWRDLYNLRGVTKNHAVIDVNTHTDDPEEFIVSNIPGLMYILRTFPFTNSDVTKLLVRAPGQEKGHLNLRVKNRGVETIQTEALGDVETYHIEVSVVLPIVGGFLPKLNYYFRTDEQRTLVRMKGLMPGTGNKIDVVLQSYEMRE